MRSVLLAVLLVAHHATAVQYDASMTVTLKGNISRLDWSNPHVHVYLDVKAGDSRGENWDVEFASRGGVVVAGLSRDLLKVGSVITIKGYPSKFAKSPHSACATEVTLDDGTTAHFVVGI